MSLMRALVAATVAVMILLSPLESLAQTASSRGMGSVTWDGWRLSPQERQQAIQQAKLSAVEAYLAETSPSRMRLFATRRDELANTIDRYVLSSQVLEETEDKKSKSFSVVIRAELNAALLQADLDAASATAQTHANERSLIAVLFMSRMQGSVQSFDDRVYKRTDATASSNESTDYRENISESERITGSQVELSGTAQSQQQRDANLTVTSTSGGSVTQRAAAVTWDVASANEINARMSGVFGAAGYEVVEAEYVEAESRGQLSVERVRSDFSTGDDLSADVLRSTVDGVRAAGIPFLAFGTLDVGMRDIDPVTGNTRIFVTVTGKVLYIMGRFPRTVSAVGPVQFAGLGPNETVARNNALALAAEKAAQIMVDEMNLRGVR